EERIGCFGLTKNGLLMLFKTEKGLEEERQVAELARRLNLSAEILTPEQAVEKNPAIEMDIAGAVYYAEDCHLDPRRLIPALIRSLEQDGVEFAWSTEASGWRADSGRIKALATNQ